MTIIHFVRSTSTFRLKLQDSFILMNLLVNTFI